jgi:hypothetical protein
MNREYKFLAIFIVIFLLAMISKADSFVLSGTVPDRGFKIVNNQIQPQEGSQLIVTVNNNFVTVRAL